MKRVRITSNGKPGGTIVENADTGQRIGNVRKVTFDHDARGLPTITLELLALDGIELNIEGRPTCTLREIAADGDPTVDNLIFHHAARPRPTKFPVFVVAGNVQQFEIYARKNQLSRDQARYVSTINTLRGLDLDPSQIVLCGSYYERDDIEEIQREIVIVTKGRA